MRLVPIRPVLASYLGLATLAAAAGAIRLRSSGELPGLAAVELVLLALPWSLALGVEALSRLGARGMAGIVLGGVVLNSVLIVKLGAAVNRASGEPDGRMSPPPWHRGNRAAAPGARHAWAWLLLVAALAVHVADEALTGFLGFYNPLVLEIRFRAPWFPAPSFEFGPWLAGLAVVVVLLALLAGAVRRGARGTRAAAWLFSGVMFANGMGHLVGSAYFNRWLPGATTAPLLLFASVLLARRTWQRGQALL